MRKVESSHLRTVELDKIEFEEGVEENVLFISFKNGSKYMYEDVTEEEYKSLLRAKSKGKFFWNNIREDKSTTLIKKGSRVKKHK